MYHDVTHQPLSCLSIFLMLYLSVLLTLLFTLLSPTCLSILPELTSQYLANNYSPYSSPSYVCTYVCLSILLSQYLANNYSLYPSVSVSCSPLSSLNTPLSYVSVLTLPSPA